MLNALQQAEIIQKHQAYVLQAAIEDIYERLKQGSKRDLERGPDANAPIDDGPIVSTKYMNQK